MKTNVIRALLLEDNPDDASLVEFELQANGLEADCQRVSCEADYRRSLVDPPDIILADYTLPGFGAPLALRILRELDLDVPFIVVTGSIGEDKAVECMREGAADYLLKDRLARLGPAVHRALLAKQARDERRRAIAELERLKRAAEQERDYLREELKSDRGFGAIVGESAALRRVLELVRAVAPTRASVLIHGESGTGKELIARAIHEQGERASAPLVKVNCASIPNELFESEFFGHVKGSFTGAHRNRTGRFELAAGGTLFLDEVGEIPLEMQSKLLRVLQEGEFERVGDDRTLRADVRVIAATNRDLEAEVQAGRFRRDLFYRLSVFPIQVPALRHRPEDVLPLAEFFLRRYRSELRRPELSLSEEQCRILTRYDWPGNIRELEHVIERAVILSPAPPLRLDLALSPSAATPAPSAILTDAALKNLERTNLIAALERSGWRVNGSTGAAELLGIHPSTLRDRMKSLGIQRREG